MDGKKKYKVKDKKKNFFMGMRDGIPIALGYFAVSFALGITAKKAGLSVFQATLYSALCNASAGEYAGFTVIAGDAPYMEMMIVTLIVNARYLLMSASLSQKIAPELPLKHRLFMGYCVTDEIFGASSVYPGVLNPFYTYGLAVCSLSFWAIGTGMGVVFGEIFSPELTEALGVSLFGMFIAIIIPPARKKKLLLVFIAASMALSFLMSVIMPTVAESTRIIILTVVISLAAAVLFPIKEEDEDDA